jgi:outer membrane protein insertion porin family
MMHSRKSYRHICVALLIGSLWIAPFAALAQEGGGRIAVLPFDVRAPGDAANIQRSIEEIFNRQLGTEGSRVVDRQEIDKLIGPGEVVRTDERARAVGQRAGANYALYGSFNQVGNKISLDARLVDVSGRKATQAAFAEESGLENLASATSQVVKRLAVHLFEKAIIADVQVKGNDRIEAEAIRNVAKSKRGELLRPEQVSEDIKAIHGMGFFETVQADVSDSPAGKVLTFIVQENPTIQEVRFTGNRKIKEKDLQAAIATRPFTVLQQHVIAEDGQKILKLYQQKGYHNAEVTPKIDFPKDPRRAVVSFSIKEGGKLFVKGINFTGNEEFSDRKLRGVMQTKRRTILSWVTDAGILQRDILETDIDRLSVFYHDRGYMDAKVGTPQVDRRENGFYINIPIQEGKRYKIREVSFTGDKLDDEKVQREMMKTIKSRKGEYFSREDLRKDIDAISRTYMDQGFAHTAVDPQVKRAPESLTTDITFHVEKKGKVQISRIFVTGNTKTRDHVIRRELRISEGDTFSATKLQDSMTRLRKLDFFEEVEITPTEAESSGLMNLNVRVKEKLTGSISVGGGFSSDSGVFVSGEVIQRNLWGKGEYVAAKAFLGEEAQRYIVSYTKPWIFGSPWSAGIDLFDWNREFASFSKDSFGVRLRGSYPLGNHSRFTTSYLFENAFVDDVPANATLFVLEQKGRNIKSSVTVGLERDTTDHPFLPTKGSINALTAEYSAPFIGSDSHFGKLTYQAGWYFPLFWKFIGHARGEIGTIGELDEEDHPVPIFDRFFLGGIDSLRAFNWGDVGPKQRRVVTTTIGGVTRDVVVEDVIGGLNYAFVSAEVIFPIYEKYGIRGLVFFDAGNSYLSGFDVSDFRTDAGAGVRWNSPLGPLRVEWGYNLDPLPGEDRSQWQFSTGAFF